MKRVQHVKPIGIAAAMMLFVVMTMFAMGGNDEEAQYLLSFDVNPSVEIELNEEEEVLEVAALNEEAKDLELEDLEGKNVEEFMDAYLEKIAEKGHLNEESAQVLLSYAHLLEEDADATDLVNRVTEQMQAYFDNENLEVDINTYFADIMNRENAREEGLSLGKFQLIEAIRNEGEEDSEEPMDPEELREKPVKELLEHPVFERHPRDWDKEEGEKPHPVFDVHPRDWDKEDGKKPHPVFDEHPGKRGNEEQNEDEELEEDEAEALEEEKENRKEKKHPVFDEHPRDRDKEAGEHPVFDEHPGERDQEQEENRDENREQDENQDENREQEENRDENHEENRDREEGPGNPDDDNAGGMRNGGN